MISGYIQQWESERHFFPSAFHRAFSFWLERGPENFAVGRHAIEGDSIYMSVQQGMTEPASQRRFELHRDYVDIQLLLRGIEVQDYYSLQPPSVRNSEYFERISKVLSFSQPGVFPALQEDCLDSSDVAFYNRPEAAQRLVQEAGQYIVYLPYELHCPMCAPSDGVPGEVFKVVFKIHRDCLC